MTLPDDDRGLLLGDGLFETLMAVEGRLLYAEAHYARLWQGCVAIDLPGPDFDAFQLACEASVRAAGLKATRAIVRLNLTAGSGGRGLARLDQPDIRIWARAFPLGPTPLEVGLRPSTIRRNESSPTSRYKTLNYLDNIMARHEARRMGFDDALMCNSRGEICCASAANIFWWEDGRLLTPALDCGVLAGVTRSRVLELAPGLGIDVAEVHIPYDPARLAGGGFICNSVMGLVPLSRIGDTTLPGLEAFDALKAAFRANQQA